MSMSMKAPILRRHYRSLKMPKTSRPSVCNAEEVLLVHSAVAEKFLPLLQKKLVEERKEKGEIPVELRLCDRAAKIISGTLAGADDFDTEFLDYIHCGKNSR